MELITFPIGIGLFFWGEKLVIDGEKRKDQRKKPASKRAMSFSKG